MGEFLFGEFKTGIGTSPEFKDLYNAVAIAVETGNFPRAREILSATTGDYPEVTVYVRHCIAAHYNIAL